MYLVVISMGGKFAARFRTEDQCKAFQEKHGVEMQWYFEPNLRPSYSEWVIDEYK